MPDSFGRAIRAAGRSSRIVLVLSFTVLAAASAQSGDITGVTHAAAGQAPLAGVMVTVEGTQLGALSDAQGRFHIDAVPAGSHTILARRLGLDSLRLSVQVREGGTTHVALVLREAAAILQPVIVSATREAERRGESSVTIDVLGADEIESAHASHPAQLLNRLPGVHVSELSGEGHSMAIRQPITTKPMYLYLEDGIPTRATGFFNHNALYEVNLPQASGVEILKGPGTALYGSDAIAGVINVRTSPAPAVPTADASVEGGAYGYERLLLTGGTPFASGGLRADLNLTRSDGWRDNAGYDRQSATLRWDLDGSNGPTARTILTGTHVDQHDVYTLSEQDYQARSSINRSPIAFRKVDALRLSSALEWERRSALFSLTPYARYDKLQLIPFWQLTYDPQIWDTRNYSAGLLAKYRRDLEPMRTRIIAGADADFSPGSFTANRVITTPENAGRVWSSYQTGERHYDYDVTYRSVSPYLHVELSPLPRLRVNGGLRLDMAGYDYNTNLPPTGDTVRTHKRPPSTTVSYTHLSPKLGATIDLGRGSSLYASYRHGFRAPSQGQLFQQGSASNTLGLAPVKVDSYELGVRGEGWGRLIYQLAVFDMTIRDDIITYITPENQRVATNAGKTRHRGVEASMGIVVAPGLRLDGSYSISRQEYVHWSPSATVAYDDKRMEQAPRDLASVLISYSPSVLRGSKVAVEWTHTGSYPMDPANTRFYGGHELINIHANVPLTPSAQLFARAMNVADSRYAEVASYDAFQGAQYNPGTPRAIYAGVRYDWRGK